MWQCWKNFSHCLLVYPDLIQCVWKSDLLQHFWISKSSLFSLSFCSFTIYLFLYTNKCSSSESRIAGCWSWSQLPLAKGRLVFIAHLQPPKWTKQFPAAQWCHFTASQHYELKPYCTNDNHKTDIDKGRQGVFKQ